ncbi:hypothetical protein Trydic_g9849 [Trypoxylus dichotomus]
MFQNWILRMALNASWLIRNTTLHEDVGVEQLMGFMRRIATQFFDRALEPPRVGVSGLLLQDPLEVRLTTITRRGPPGLTAAHPT